QNKIDFLLVFTAFLLLGIAAYYALKRKSLKFMEKLCLSLIFGGGCGNFISRATAGCVTDFLDIHIIPVFNVADICVTGGCFLLIFYYFFVEGKKSRDPEKEPGASEVPEGESRDERGEHI
ncbi:MAG: signal peptidase II, partial [Clostridia bacterium]|nr:signal peptidase II [Clostridia bacterium]